MGNIHKFVQDNDALNVFLQTNQERTFSVLMRLYQCSKQDFESIYQDSTIVLLENIRSNKLVNLTSSLYSYFLGICRNKAKSFMRDNGKVHFCSIIDDNDGEIIDEQIDKILLGENYEEKVRKRKIYIVRSILANMPKHCKELLMGHYGEDLSWSTIAASAGLANGNVAKMTGKRCKDRFKVRYKDLLEELDIYSVDNDFDEGVLCNEYNDVSDSND